MGEISVINVQKLYEQSLTMLTEYGPKFLLSIVLLLIGLWLIKQLVKLVNKILLKGDFNETLHSFLLNFISWSFRLLLFLSVASMIGIKTTSFIAVLSLAALATGFALKGRVSDLAGGILLLVSKPYKVGDLIEAQGQFGKVKSLQIFDTILITNTKKTVIIPNGLMANTNIINFTTEGKLRIDLSVLISYSYDLKKVKEVLLSVLENDPKVLKDPAPFVGVYGFEGDSVNYAVRPWANADDYWAVYFGVNEKMKLALEAKGILIPELKWTDVKIN